MPSLKQTQQLIQAYIRTGGLDALAIVDSNTALAMERLQIYRSAYFLRIIDLLKEHYPRLCEQLGKVGFGQLVHDYLARYPSEYYNLLFLGERLPLFMAETQRYRLDLIELAEVEWALFSVLFCKTEPILLQHQLISLMASGGLDYRFKIIEAHVIKTVHKATAAYFDRTHSSETVCMLIWRKPHQDQACYQIISLEEKALLECFTNSFDFAKVCEEMSHYLPDEQGSAFILDRLVYWIKQELFVNTEGE